MTMYRRILAVVAVVLVVAGVGGFFMLKESAPGPLHWSDRAEVTGYATSTVGGHTSGAVSVDLAGAPAARIDAIVEGLPRANLRYICAENAQEYHIAFSAEAGAGVRQGFALTGYWCNNLVVEVPLDGPTVDRIDRDCALLAAVRRLLPAKAIATHAGTCADANGRLFVAVSRHRTLRHRTAARKTPSSTHKTPAAKTPAPKTPAPRTPAPRTPAPRTPAPRTPAPRTPAPKTPAAKSPRHKSPRREAPKQARVRRGTPVHVVPGHGTLVRVMPQREPRDVKKVVLAPTLG